MTAHLEEIILNKDESFFIGIFQDNLEKSTWHYHSNFEISFITEGSGKRIVADSVEEFHPGDLVFIGRNLPHVWIADKDQIALSNRTLEMVFLQFTSDVICQHMLSLPEFKYIQKALIFSERGIQITGKTLNEVSELMLQMPYLKSLDKMIHFLRIMDLIGRSDSLIPLASKNYMETRFTTENTRIAAIHDYLMRNYRDKIKLSNLSEIINMAEGSLCRFFRQKMGMTIFQYLNKIKVDFACKLLIDTDMNIIDICFDSGFNNLSHFNKQFKKITGLTPKEYRKKFAGFI